MKETNQKAYPPYFTWYGKTMGANVQIKNHAFGHSVFSRAAPPVTGFDPFRSLQTGSAILLGTNI